MFTKNNTKNVWWTTFLAPVFISLVYIIVKWQLSCSVEWGAIRYLGCTEARILENMDTRIVCRQHFRRWETRRTLRVPLKSQFPFYTFTIYENLPQGNCCEKYYWDKKSLLKDLPYVTSFLQWQFPCEFG